MLLIYEYITYRANCIKIRRLIEVDVLIRKLQCLFLDVGWFFLECFFILFLRYLLIDKIKNTLQAQHTHTHTHMQTTKTYISRSDVQIRTYTYTSTRFRSVHPSPYSVCSVEEETQIEFEITLKLN